MSRKIDYPSDECPKCKSEDISGEMFDRAGNEVWQPVHCNICDFEWNEIYTFSHADTCDCDLPLDEDGNVVKGTEE